MSSAGAAGPPTTLALVPARGGSRTIPRKNITPLAGRPLIAYALDAIRESGTADRTCVSTDDEEIAAVALEHGAEVPFLRPAALAHDETPASAVVEHALDWLAAHEAFEPECVLLVQPTEPFARPSHIRDALDLMLARGADSAITMVEVPRRFHPFHIRVLDEEGFLEFERPKEHYAHPARQLDPPRYAFGNLYWFRRAAFLEHRQIEVGRRVGLLIDAVSSLDVDDSDDLALAEALAERGLLPR